MNTAKAMAEGACKAGLLKTIPEITTDTTLVEPGCYVEDLNEVGPTF